jgi:hypothetical protein
LAYVLIGAQTVEVAVYPYRIFISYTREDRALAKMMADALQSVGLIPLWDQDIRPGLRFSDAIRNAIATAHIFMPLITERSQNRPWVHQETGYAIGINVPVLPVALKTLPGEMIAELQAITVEPDFCDLAQHLQEPDLDPIVRCPPPLHLSERKSPKCRNSAQGGSFSVRTGCWTMADTATSDSGPYSRLFRFPTKTCVIRSGTGTMEHPRRVLN